MPGAPINNNLVAKFRVPVYDSCSVVFNSNIGAANRRRGLHVIDLPLLQCENCGHEMGAAKAVARVGVDRIAGATKHESRYLIGVFDILRGGDALLAEGIKRVAESRERKK